MPFIRYVKKRFSPECQAIIDHANRIIEDHANKGFTLTLRQLYYQFVGEALIPNTERSYKNLGNVINNARLAGLVDWDAIEDRMRSMVQNSHWAGPDDIVDTCSRQFQYDKWLRQSIRVECWVEKDALVGVLASVCQPLDVPYFACRGYTSQSEMWRASQRFRGFIEDDEQEVLILYLGDHDPSGLDMTRDVKDRLELFLGPKSAELLRVKRLALNMNQIEEYEPPPNPAKVTDSRSGPYMEEFGDESWELDALDVTVLADLIRENILDVRDDETWEESIAEENKAKEELSQVSANWQGITGWLKTQERRRKK